MEAGGEAIVDAETIMELVRDDAEPVAQLDRLGSEFMIYPK
jgi:hypothetical protein